MEHRSKIPKGTPIYGVDVGNGYGKVSLLRAVNEDPQFLLPEALRSGMPSTAYVSPEDGSIQVYGAKRKLSSRAVRAVKTRMREGSIELEENGKTFRVSPSAVYAAIARDLVALANKERNNQGEPPVYQLVLTYPASLRFEPALLGLLKQSVGSVELDGRKLEVCGMLSEPAAVAVDYLYYVRNLAKDPITATQYTILVYDLGHGTFDTAVVTAYTDSDKDCDLICQDGDPEIGGRKFDELLYNELSSQVRKQVGPKAPISRENLRRLAVEMKHELSVDTLSERDFYVGDREVLLRVARERFEALISPQIHRTLELVQSQLDEAKAKGVSVDAIVLSGGSSNIPMIRQALIELTDHALPVEVYRPSEGVTFGAARAAHDLYEEANDQKPSVPTLTQHCERSCGVRIGETIYLLLDEEAVLPCTSQSFPFRSSPSGRSMIILQHANDPLAGAKTAERSACREILRLYMELPPEQNCTLTMRMDLDRCIYVDCTLPDGRVITQSTFHTK